MAQIELLKDTLHNPRQIRRMLSEILMLSRHFLLLQRLRYGPEQFLQKEKRVSRGRVINRRLPTHLALVIRHGTLRRCTHLGVSTMQQFIARWRCCAVVASQTAAAAT